MCMTPFIDAMSRNMSDKVLDYHDILLREEDVDSLRGSSWLNDQASHP